MQHKQNERLFLEGNDLRKKSKTAVPLVGWAGCDPSKCAGKNAWPKQQGNQPILQNPDGPSASETTGAVKTGGLSGPLGATPSAACVA